MTFLKVVFRISQNMQLSSAFEILIGHLKKILHVTNGA